MPEIGPGCALQPEGGRWVLRGTDGSNLATYEFDALRFSVSWKAYCFVDEQERVEWRDHADDLDLTAALDALVTDLTRRGVADASTPRAELGSLLIDEYVRFPPATESVGSS
jgi:hypothetical protein